MVLGENWSYASRKIKTLFSMHTYKSPSFGVHNKRDNALLKLLVCPLLPNWSSQGELVFLFVCNLVFFKKIISDSIFLFLKLEKRTYRLISNNLLNKIKYLSKRQSLVQTNNILVAARQLKKPQGFYISQNKE